MVKFRKTFELKHKINTPKNSFQNKFQENSCQVFSLPDRFMLSKNKSLFFANKIGRSSFPNLILNSVDSVFEKQDLQFFYSLCIAVFALETTFKKSKNSNLLSSFNFEKLIFLSNNSKIDKNKTDLNLLFFYNFSFLMQSYLNLFSAHHVNSLVNPKVLVSLLFTIQSGIQITVKPVGQHWTLRRTFRKIQAIHTLNGNSMLTYANLLLFWSSHKKIVSLSSNRKEDQYLYHLRRFLDKNDALGEINSVDANESYLDLLSLLFEHKSQKYRLMYLKNVLRKPLRRRVSRWALLPRLFVKERQQDQSAFQEIDGIDGLFKAENTQLQNTDEN